MCKNLKCKQLSVEYRSICSWESKQKKKNEKSNDHLGAGWMDGCMFLFVAQDVYLK